MNEYYNKGKKLLDLSCTTEAEKIFNAGLKSGDIKCIYGLIAVKATRQENYDYETSLLMNNFDNLSLMAKNNDPDACFILGRCYELGIGLNADLLKAITYYKKSADNKNSDAMFNLGCIYHYLNPDNTEKYLSYFKNSAKLGNTHAAKTLSHFYNEK